ncbi:hypothetical protein [Neobacillus sp. SAB-20_R2A]|uniref:hypothetical protein n=1 Tax=Neobacillus sp. SAB-20_R2A TaxID=3120519 RepID=UPI003C6E7F58
MSEEMEQKQETKIVGEEHIQLEVSGLDLLWRAAFRKMDEGAKRAEFEDEVFLKRAKLFADSVGRSQADMKEITDKFTKEFAQWEKTARDELFMSTTSLAHFFPIKSFKEINEQLELIHQKTLSLLNRPCQFITNTEAADKYFAMIEQYISLRKKARSRYLTTLKQAGNLVYENQKVFVNLFSKQISTFVFPLNKYLERSTIRKF